MTVTTADTTPESTALTATLTEGSTLMAYPPGVSLATITIGAGRTMFGTPPKLISATVTPVFKGTPHVVHADSGWAFYPTPQTFRVENGEDLTFQLPHVDAPGWRDTAGNEFPALLDSGERDKGWAYHAKFTVVGGSGQDSVPHRYEKVFQPLVGQTMPIDVDLVPDGRIGEPVSAPVAAVTSILGLVGEISAEDLDAAGFAVGASDEDIALLMQDPSSATSTAVVSAVDTYAPKPLQWQTSRAVDVTAPPRVEDRPKVEFAAGMTTKLTTPVEYKPKGVGGGTAVTSWNGQDDPTFQFWPGEFYTRNGGAQDLALEGRIKPGGGAQAAGWPVVYTFMTNSPVVELAYYGTGLGMSLLFEVNGRMVDDTRFSASDLGSSATCTLTFPQDGRTRWVRVFGASSPGLAAVRVLTGRTVTKPTTSGRLAAVIGDSFANGAGSSTSFPDQGAGNLETFAPRLFRMLGYNRQMLAAIGGTGYTTTSPFSERVPAVLAAAPDMLMLYGTVNDWQATEANLQAAVEGVLASVDTVPEVLVVPPGVSTHVMQRRALSAAVEASGVGKYIELGDFFYGTGKVTAPTGDGNNDVFRMGDGTHPTLDGHRALARGLYELVAG